jgi:hypothetical protein
VTAAPARHAARALLVVFGLAPWLSWLPLSGSFAGIVVLTTLTIGGAAHGWGQLVARASGRHVPLVLALACGLAAMALLGGALMAVHADDDRGRNALLVVGVIAHTVDLVRDRTARDRLLTALRVRPIAPWLIPALVVAALAALHVLGNAGDLHARTFDDDGNHLGQLQRLADTGTLGDRLGFPRTAQLGGQLALESLTGQTGDLRAFRMIDGGLGFALTALLVVALVRPRETRAGIWTTLILLALSASPLLVPDAAGYWLPIAFILAAYHALRDAPGDSLRERLPLAVLAAALASLHHEFIPIALVLLIAGGAAPARAQRPAWMIALVAIGAALLLPFAATRQLAGYAVAAHLLAPSTLHPGLAPLALVALVLVPILCFAFVDHRPTRPLRWLAIATALAIGALVVRATAELPYGYRFLAPMVIAFVVALLADQAAQQPGLTFCAHGELLLAFVALTLIARGRDGDGSPRAAWPRRYAALFANLEFAARQPATIARTHRYDDLLAPIPADAIIALWVDHPEDLDYRRHALVDLRTPRLAKLQSAAWITSPLPAQTVAAIHARYLLLEGDNAHLARADDDLLYRIACTGRAPRPRGCISPLAQLALDHPVVAEHGIVKLIDLAR